MNMLEKMFPEKKTPSNEHIITFEEFRKDQYDQIKYFVNLCVNYISKQKNNYLKHSETIIKEDLKYQDVFGYSRTRIQVKIDDSESKNGKKLFLSFLIPTLIDGSFFFINGSYYSPTCYILDKPISIKKKSLKLFGLFNSITIFTKG